MRLSVTVSYQTMFFTARSVTALEHGPQILAPVSRDSVGLLMKPGITYRHEPLDCRVALRLSTGAIENSSDVRAIATPVHHVRFLGFQTRPHYDPFIPFNRKELRIFSRVEARSAALDGTSK